MTNQQTTNKNNTFVNGKTQVKSFFENLTATTAYKVAVVATVAMAGLLALGGLYRVLAWTMQGWNQLAATFKR
jgi:hypothetical protein